MKKSAVDAAWEEYFASCKVDDLDELRKEGWRTVYDVMEITGRARKTLDASRHFERKRVKIMGESGLIRNHTLLRPKIKG